MKQLLLVLFFIPTIIFSQGKLKKAKGNLKEKSTQKTNKETRVVRAYESSGSDDSTRLNITGDFQFFIFRAVFWATYGALIGEAEERDLNPYPYFYDDEGEYAKVLSNTGRKQSLKLGGNYVFNNIDGFELNGLYKPLPILGIKASHIHFSEKIRIDTDFLDISSLSVNYYRVREKNISLWWGIGATHVSNGVNKLGFLYNLGVDIYPFKPISLHASWQESFINSRSISVFKSQFKYHLKEKSIFAGYHIYQIAGQVIKGPTVGFEIIF